MPGKKDSIATPDHLARMVMLIYGTMSDTNPFWCFVSVKPSQHSRLQRLVAEKKFDIRNFVKDGFGEIIVSGEGVVPPGDVVKKVAQMFNIPIRDLFRDDYDMDAIIAKEVERVKKELGEN